MIEIFKVILLSFFKKYTTVEKKKVHFLKGML